MSRIIRTSRLTLRPLGPEDIVPITRMIGDIEVARWLANVPHPYTEADAARYLETFAPDWRFGIEVLGSLAGVASIDKALGYWMGRHYWGQGLMQEACAAVLARWFAEGGADVTASHFDDNHGSAAILRRMGFRDLGAARLMCTATGLEMPARMLRLTAAAWAVSDGARQAGGPGALAARESDMAN